MRIEKVYLLSNQSTTPAGSLNRKKKLALIKTIADARINQMGDQRQMTAFGQVYADARIVRVSGSHAAERIGLGDMDSKSFEPNYAITKIAHHQHKTDFYIIVDKKLVGGDLSGN
ncbi:hypothetical protein ABC418_13930 [Lactiplantibacillus plantarum]|uniref:hypothetical protein n=1 Tax=Lactiplantibacillus plantarum TaxID=1590 RepID=UPI0039659162